MATASVEIGNSSLGVVTPSEEVGKSPTSKLEATCTNLQTSVDDLKATNKKHWNETVRNERTLLDLKRNVHDGFWGGAFIVALLILLTVGVVFLQQDVNLQKRQYEVVQKSIDSTVSAALAKAMKVKTEPPAQPDACTNDDDLPSIACPSGPKSPFVTLEPVAALRRVTFLFDDKIYSLAKFMQQMGNKPEHETSLVALKDEMFVLKKTIEIAKAFATHLDGNPNPKARFPLGNSRSRGWVARYAVYEHLHHAMVKYNVLVGIELDVHGAVFIYCY